MSEHEHEHEHETTAETASHDDDVIDITVGIEEGETSVAFDEPPEVLARTEPAETADEAEADDEADDDEPVADEDDEDAEIAISLSSRLSRPENAETAAASAAALDAVLNDLAGEGRSPAQEVCAQLFSSHVPLTEEQLAENLHLAEETVRGALARLEQTLAVSPFGVFRRRLEVPGKKEPVTGFVLDLKPAYRQRVAAVGRPVLSPAMTETLALIALNQPIGQSRLVRERGTSVYEHVKDLLKRDWIARSRKGRSYELRTTEAFAAEFGLPNDPELIKRALARAAGVEGSPDVIGSERVRIEGAEGAPPPELVEEARQAMAEVQDRMAELMNAPQPVEDCVVSGGEYVAPTSEATPSADTATPADDDVTLPPHVLAALRAAETETSGSGEKIDPQRSASFTRSGIPVTTRPAATSPWRKKEPAVSESPAETTTETPSETPPADAPPSRVAHLLSLLGDETTSDDW